LDKRKTSVERQPPTALERGEISAYRSYYIASVESVSRASLCKTKRWPTWRFNQARLIASNIAKLAE